MTDETPPWLSIMQSLTGTKEVSGSGANPVITGMSEEIARLFPETEWYCDLPSWDSDETAWCGMAAGFCVAQAGFRPPWQDQPADDTQRWGWAQSWASDDNYVHMSSPVPGTIVVLKREGGGHVTFYESTNSSGQYMCRGGNQSNSVNLSPYNKSDVIALVWPKDYPMPAVPRSTIQKGSTGPDVVACQNMLRVYPADGDFGSITDGAVKGFQAACSISQDGVVGPVTWEKLDDLVARAKKGNDGLPPEMIEQIVAVAEGSAIANYSWRDRGKAPLGYTAGLALCFALALDRLNAEDEAAWEMAKPNTNDSDDDVFAWYAPEFAAAGMDNSEEVTEEDRLRHLFALMLGLGMRESSGRYSEGRDQSASNVSSDTAEAGLFQTSWNIRSCDGTIPPLLSQYWLNPNGFQPQFKKGVTLKSSDLGGFGSGGGAQYQFLSKYAPSFHALVTALGLRNLRQHWGPINRREVELKNQADEMLAAVQDIVEDGVEPAPEPPEPTHEHQVDIVAAHPDDIDEVIITGDVYVTVNGKPWGEGS